MNGYSLVIDISADEENIRKSTPIKSLPVNMVGKAKPSDSSTEVFRECDPEFESTFDSGCLPKKLKIISIKKAKKNKRVKFNLPNPPTTKGSDSEEDFNEEPDSPPNPSPAPRDADNPATNSLNDLNEPLRKLRRKLPRNTWTPGVHPRQKITLQN